MSKGSPAPKALPIAGLVTFGGPGFMLLAKEMNWALPFPVVVIIGAASIVALVLGAILSIVWAWRWLRQQRDPNSVLNKIRLVARHNVIPIILALVGGVGLLLVGAASVGAYYYYSSQNPANGDKKVTSNPSPSEPAGPQPLKRMFTAYDVEQRLRAIDAIDDKLVKVVDLRQRAQDFLNRIEHFIRAGEAPALLLAYTKDSKEVFDELRSVLAIYDSRFPEITRAVSDSNEVHRILDIPASTSLLRDEIEKWAAQGDPMPMIANSRFLSEWRQSLGILRDSWLDQVRSALILKRREYEAAEVYPVNRTEGPATRDAQPYYTRGDIDRLLEALFQVSDLIAKKGIPLRANADAFLSRWDTIILTEGEPEFRSRAKKVRLEIEALEQGTWDVINGNQHYVTELAKVFPDRAPVQRIRDSLIKLVQTGEKLPSPPDERTVAILLPLRNEVGLAYAEFSQWMSQVFDRATEETKRLRAAPQKGS